MRLLLLLLLLFPSLSLADTWKKTTHKDKMYDYNYDVIQNSSGTVLVVCANSNAVVSIDFRKFVGLPNDGIFTFRFDSDEPIEWDIEDADLTILSFSKAFYFVEGLVKSKKITTRVSSEHVFAEKTIDATGFASAFNSSRDCKDSVASWKLEFEQPNEDASFSLVNSNESGLLFIDKEYFSSKENKTWYLYYLFDKSNDNKQSGGNIFLNEKKINCAKKTYQDVSLSTYDENGVYSEGVITHENPKEMDKISLKFVCENQILEDYIAFPNISSVKEAIEFSKRYKEESKISHPTPPIFDWDKCKEASVLPKLISEFDVDYLVDALTKVLNGEIKVRVNIDEQGRASNANIVSYSDVAFSDPKIIEGINQLKFSPARKNCKEVSIVHEFTIKFH